MTAPSSNLLPELLSRCRFAPASSVVTCAVSGGADSLALLVLAAAAGLDVTAVHVDHGLRDGSAAEADVVAAACDRFGATFRSVRVEVVPGPNLEARARAARYAALPADVLTGHTLDDQAETVLLHLIRGSGLDGLAGMTPSERRPLLRLRRAETAALCAELGLSPVVDPTNDDPRHRRNRVRHEVLPLLDDVADRDVAPVLARQADVLRDEAALLDELASAVEASDAVALAAAPAALARRAIRGWLVAQTGSGYPPSSADVARVLAVARGEGTACEVTGGWRVARSAQRLSATPPARDDPPGSAASIHYDV